jgi:hypothetical protein
MFQGKDENCVKKMVSDSFSDLNHIEKKKELIYLKVFLCCIYFQVWSKN